MSNIPRVHSGQLRHNSVRAYKNAQLVERHSYRVFDKRINAETDVVLALYHGMASSGYHSNMERRETWWVELSVGRRTNGHRYSGQHARRDAQRDYSEAITHWEKGTQVTRS